jgi:alpha-amylase
MTEWALPADQLVRYEHLRHDLEHDQRWPQLSRYMRGGFWRNFKVKYPEADEMYTRMMMVSDRLHSARQDGVHNDWLESAQRELYRGQCNCSYWHGAFGGIYLPHLRHAVFNHLIAAENLLYRAINRRTPWVEATVGDYNLDARQEVWLSNEKLAMLFAPVRGGQMYELDVRSICLNLLGSLARREEAYHQKVRAGAAGANGQVASIHERVVFKQAGLDRRLQYDQSVRKSLLDHFYDPQVTLEQVATGQAAERGDFAGVYETRVRRGPDRIQVVLSRRGKAAGHPIRITKTIELEAGSPIIKIVYDLDELPRELQHAPLHFAVELNFAGLPAGADDRYFHHSQRGRLGQLGSRLDLADVQDLGLTDEWLGIDVQLRLSRLSQMWTFPIETVSQSEGGFELVHQSIVVQPHWLVTPDAVGRWQTTILMEVNTALAQSRMEKPAAAAVTV